MSALEATVLWVHIAAGVVALFAGTGALVTTKGGLRHRQAGKIFVASMGIVVGTVLPLFAFEPTDFFRQFLLLVAIFSGYLTFSGYRAISRKQPGGGVAPIDWVAGGVVVLACLGLAVMGGSFLVGGDSFGVVMVVFGLIGGSFGAVDMRSFRIDENGEWIVDHLTRMMGAYIATVTAVAAVNLQMLPVVVTWLGPTAVGVPLIFYWRRKYGPD
jgi:uncharacterized membrane protein